MAWQISFFQILFYSSLYSSIVISILMIYRKVFGKRFRPSSRILLWYATLALIVLTMAFFSKGNFLRGYIGTSIRIPPIEISFEKKAVIMNENGIDILQLTGEIDMRVINYVTRKSYTYNGNVILQFAFMIWLFGIISIFFYYIINYLQLTKKLKAYDECNEEGLATIIKNEARFLGLDFPTIKLVPQKQFKRIFTPTIIGYTKPTLLILYEQWEQLDSNEKQAILMNGMMFIKHKDNYMNLFLIVLNAIQWINPFLYLGFKLLRQDRDCLRDKQITRWLSEEEQYTYANVIFKVAKMNHSKYFNALYSGMLLVNGLGLRMEFLAVKEKKICVLEIVAILFFITLLLVMIFSRYTIGFISNVSTLL